MKPSFRVWWLIIVGCVALHLSGWNAAVVLVVYAVVEYWEQRQARKARVKVFEDVMDGWEQCKDDSEYEEKGDFSRVRLAGQNQIIAARIAELVSRMP